MEALDSGYTPYTEAHMELSKKTTILFSPELHAHLVRLAAQRGTSLGELVRSACVRAYGASSPSDRLAAVAELAGLALPIGSPQQMEAESVPEDELA